MRQLTLLILISLFSIAVWSNNKGFPLIGDKAPSFTEKSTNGILNSRKILGKTGRFYSAIRSILRRFVHRNFSGWLTARKNLIHWE